MARRKEFEQDVVLTAMMKVFWQQGYDATSMRDLEKATKLSPSSLYNEFGSKESLFDRVLNHYLDVVIGKRITAYLEDYTPSVLGIRLFLMDAFKDVPEEFAHLSCLLVNTAAEMGQTNLTFAASVNTGLKKVETALINAVKQAQLDGDILSHIDSKIIAGQLSTLMPGLLIASKNKSNPEKLTQILDFTFQQIANVK